MKQPLQRLTVLQLCAASGIVGLGACTAAPPPPMRNFYLRALAEAPAGVGRGDWSLVVEPPQTAPALRTNKIAQRIGANESDYYANAAWGTRGPSCSRRC